VVVSRRLQLDPIADLRQRLRRGGSAAIVRRWWSAQGFAAHPVAVGRRVAFALLESGERKLQRAGIGVLDELLPDALNGRDLAALAALFANGTLADKATIDLLGTKLLGGLLTRSRGRVDIARELVDWRNAESAWQRRAACVAFTVIAPHGDAALDGCVRMALALCGACAWSIDRIDQTAVGVLLRELSRAEPNRVDAFVQRHARFMSRESVREAIRLLGADRQRALVAAWKRATTLRR
jgi:hypothetical protein